MHFVIALLFIAAFAAPHFEIGPDDPRVHFDGRVNHLLVSLPRGRIFLAFASNRTRGHVRLVFERKLSAAQVFSGDALDLVDQGPGGAYTYQRVEASLQPDGHLTVDFLRDQNETYRPTALRLVTPTATLVASNPASFCALVETPVVSAEAAVELLACDAVLAP